MQGEGHRLPDVHRQHAVGGNAVKLGDVLTFRNGKTAEIHNTDAEGRLVLADGLSLAVEDGPDAIVDIATLTGACMVALGTKMAGVVGNDQPLVDKLRAASAATDEPIWQLPLEKALPQAARQQRGRHAQHRRPARRRHHRVAVPQRVRRRRAVGAPRHRRPDGRRRRRRLAVASGATGFGTRLLIEFATTFTK